MTDAYRAQLTDIAQAYAAYLAADSPDQEWAALNDIHNLIENAADMLSVPLPPLCGTCGERGHDESGCQ